MTRRAALPVVLLLLAIVNTPAAPDKYAEISTNGYVKVHKAPDSTSRVIAFARNTERYPILTEGSTWIKILFIEVGGWVRRDNVKIISAEAVARADTRMVPERPATQSQAPQTGPPPATQQDQKVLPSGTVPAGQTISVPRALQPAHATPAATKPPLQQVPARSPEVARPAHAQAPAPADAYTPQARVAPHSAPAAQRQTGVEQPTGLERPAPATFHPAAPQEKPAAPAPVRKPLPQGERIAEASENTILSSDTVLLIPQDTGVPKALYAYVTKPTVRVLQYVDPQSPIVGMARQGTYYPIVYRDSMWLQIMLGDSVGWIERRLVAIVEKPSTHSRDSVLAWLLGAAVAIALAAAALLVFRSVNARMVRKVSVRKSVLIIANSDKQVENALSGGHASLDEYFSEIGFTVHRTNDLVATQNYIAHTLPDVIMVDWGYSKTVLLDVESMLLPRTSTTNVPVVFYGVPDSSSTALSSRLANVHFLGVLFTDRDLFKLITPLIITGEKGRVVHKSVQASALEGDIAQGGLVAVFQLIEIGSKTGCLVVREEKPFGMVGFDQGMVVYAAGRTTVGQPAVLEILGLRNGQFRFIADMAPPSRNCMIPVMGILMEWARAQDEATRH